ncbi:zinc ABC transporter ATP-binding protein ZnuC [Rhodovulum sulfidophilum]|uniref:Metal ABC transporter ATP-binding protein n=1 Tax=Rhodovulum visakhapatnamense TaxID=364297 RepID=A0ABS1RH57_9RHOB|nr:metal ABC transporter ATP-binding protein [Rhodovulum visakhapatnamense]MBL3567954.1 metal ABC transporter ATP-binding protein [Rhodovulum visakhapatnamense]MBL3578995.1 metal ABC transporter ATP-binding protein [Rhodovulum visakhapatnamense]OLS46313.1 zinc ABC transporter ATP-binding protein ZnuC [Rhodovulum sulfidophilum]
MTLVAARGLTVRYGGVAALTGVDFEIGPGEIVTLVGPNGSGKSTLLRAVLGAVRPTAGAVTRRPGLRIGYVPQKLAVDDRMPLTVRRFLSLPNRHGAAEVAAMLDRVGAAGLETRQLTALSGGQFQRVLLARALLGGPELLILDEATQGLDQPGTAAFYQLIVDLRRETGTAVLMVSHDLHVVMSATDRVLCLNGHVCCQGQPYVVTAAPEYRALFGHGTHGTMALYQHEHDHAHDGCGHDAAAGAEAHPHAHGAKPEAADA